MVYLVYAICSEPRVPRSGPKAVRAKTACPLRKMHIRRIRKVRIVTELFQRGEINILIGTKSLLGEGWDSPCINSLILASFVGSFILPSLTVKSAGTL